MNKKTRTTAISVIIIFSYSFLPIQGTNYYYETSINFQGATIAFDLVHGGLHATLDDLEPLAGNLTEAGNNVIFFETEWDLSDEIDALFLTQCDLYYSYTELNDIDNWMGLGDKLLWISGDSDYGGYYNSSPVNQVLAELGAIVRIDGTSISDPTYNDGASYRVAAPYIGIGDSLYDQLAQDICQGIDAGILIHGPCSILGYDGYYYKDLRYGHSIFPERVMVLMTYSEDAQADDSDVSDGDLDLYASETGGYFPAVVYENLSSYNSHIIVSGEAIYTHYKFMYDQVTENGVYNDDVNYGQMLVNNILNYFVIDSGNPTKPSTFTPTSEPTLHIAYEGVMFSFAAFVIFSILFSKRKK